MVRVRSILELLGRNLPLWILGAIFIISGLVIGGAGLKMALADLSWSQAINTAGRVIITEWKQENGENRLAVVYGYKDERGVIFHNTAVLARKLGKINLEPAAPIVVMYKADDHAQSRMQMELGSREWVPILVIAPVEIVVGGIFLTVALRRLLRKLALADQPVAVERESTASL